MEYEYEGCTYTFIESVSLKCPVTGKWYDAVLYENVMGERFVRELGDFNNKFEKVDLP